MVELLSVTRWQVLSSTSLIQRGHSNGLLSFLIHLLIIFAAKIE